MAITLPNMGINLPTPGSDRGTWDDKVNAAFMAVDAHDHTLGNGVPIRAAALNIDADIAWGGYAITALGKLTLSPVPALVSGSTTIFVSSADNELYWRNAAGVNVKLTDGTSINTTLVGGIVGDYSTVGAEVAYNDADEVYTFKDKSAPSKKWARIAAGEVRLYEHASTAAAYVELASPDTLAATYTVTWPDAVPSDNKLVRMAPSGALLLAGTLDESIELTADRDIKVSGTGDYKHGSRTVSQAPVAHITSGGTFSSTTTGAPHFVAGSGVTSYHNLVGCMAGDRILSFLASGNDAASVAPTFAAQIMGANNTITSLVVSASRSGAAFGPFTYTITVAPSQLLDAGDAVWLKIVSGTGSTDWYSVGITFDRP